MGFVHRRLLIAILYVVRHPKLTLAVSAVVLAGCALFARSRLSISTDENKLFSSDIKFFRDYLEFIHQFPENEAIYVLVRVRDPGHVPPARRWTALADQITERLAGMREYVQSVDSHVPLDQLGAQGILLDKPERVREELEGARRLAQLAGLWGRANFLTQRLGATPMERFLAGLSIARPDEETATFVNAVARSWVLRWNIPRRRCGWEAALPDLEALGGEADPERLGYYYVPDEDPDDPPQHVLLVRVYPRKNFSSLAANSKAVNTLREAVDEVARGYPEFYVGMTGRPTLEADELSTTDRDSRRAEMVALSVIFVGLVLTLRSVWLALAAEICLAVGIGWTFGYATLALGELNLLSTVFLIALIGIGMDYLIQILAAYRREARRYERPTAIWMRVFRYSGPPVMTACFGAAGAFFVSLLTNFRGAAELGIIAGGGLLLCLLAAYTVLPALLVVWPARLRQVELSERYAPPPRKRGWVGLALPVIWCAAVLCAIPWRGRRASMRICWICRCRIWNR